MKLTPSGQQKIQSWVTLRHVTRTTLDSIEFEPEDFEGGLFIDLSKHDAMVITGILELYSALVKENDGFTKPLPNIIEKLTKAYKDDEKAKESLQ